MLRELSAEYIHKKHMTVNIFLNFSSIVVAVVVVAVIVVIVVTKAYRGSSSSRDPHRHSLAPCHWASRSVRH